MTSNALKNVHIALFGCGPHAKRIYVEYLHLRGIEPSLIVDVVSKQEEITKLVKSKGWKDTKLVFLDPKDSYDAFSDEDAVMLTKLLKTLKVSKAIISTPPEVHTPFAKLCLDTGIKVLLDKPLSAPRNVSVGNSVELLDDVRDLLAYDQGDNIIIQCQRRRHDGYRFIKKLIEEVDTTYGIQPHFIDIYHSDGRWDFPDEIPKLSNHPYMTGYGKLLHSGYHFVDLLAFLTESFDYDTFDAIAYRNSINDFKAQVPDSFYKKTFNIDNQYSFPEEGFGEIDSYSLIQLKKSGRTMLTAAINLLHTGFSRRAWGTAKEDLYKGNGRIRQERVNIQIGPLMNIQVHSYQSTEVHDDQILDPNETGGLEHFDIHVFRNTGLIGGKAYELITLDSIATNTTPGVGQNEHARYQLVDDFLSGKPSESSISSHVRTNILLAAIAQSTHTKEQTKGKMAL